MKRYKTYAFLYTILLGVFLLFSNLYIYFTGVAFAEEYGATRYEITYVAAQTGGWGGNPEISVTWPSYFAYFDENDRNFVWSSKLYYEYNDMNKDANNIVETIEILGIVTMLSGIFGIFIAKTNRYTWIGYFLLVLIGMAQIMDFGVMSLEFIPLLITLGLTVYAIKKSTFQDWDRYLFLPFRRRG